MAITNDGGSAFPYGGGSDGPFPGMTLRDWFAGQAMAGWLASFGPDDGCRASGIADFAYEIADAMLVAREAPQ